MTPLRALFRRELTLRLRAGGWAVGVGTLLVLGFLAPLAIGGEQNTLRSAGPGILWLILGVAVFLGVEGLFEDDLASGATDLVLLSPVSMTRAALIKLVVAWAVLAVPLLIAMPLLLLSYGSSPWGAFALLLASPGMVFVAGTISALCTNQRRGAPLLVFLSLPLIIPPLVFGPAAGASGLAPYLILGAYSLQAVAVCPALTAAAIKLQLT
ncbi:MAG: heme exporter protein CcmB [Pseudomonadota bacterium]